MNRAPNQRDPSPCPVPEHRFCVAPMMDCTDRHYRYLARLISRRVLLYTEMLTTGAVIHGDREKLLGFDQAEHPLALQVGGSNPPEMARSARIAECLGYDEVNINVGCPSDRVQAGTFGACLMKHPETVADCVRAMRDAASVPITVKHRTGVDDRDSLEELKVFVETVARSGCDTFIIHARKAWLQGLSPKQNREVPPLNYSTVYEIKRAFPDLTIVINGGFDDLDSASRQLRHVDGVMLGRSVYSNPWLLSGVDELFFGDGPSCRDRMDVLDAYRQYCAGQLEQGVPLRRLTRALIGMFQGCRGARAWRRHISTHAHEPGAGLEVIDRAAACLDEEAHARAA